ncbi:hypothetical protein GCM10011374_39820 [Kocuria dechangensis]|uniref:Uncharacterized protein n=1 Tax=Kocuria dechangensis TaxID=1176249 RepID=A0A917M2P6_9MICC|nr:hypothetical protein [Kocuria dechangensis]GGG71189.1 hypothetical protein GCM10011374_39820 [Kocuria dechangensis]
MGHKHSCSSRAISTGPMCGLVVTGCETSQHALHPPLSGAQSVILAAMVTVDLTCAEHVEAAAVEQLHAAVDNDQALSRCRVLEEAAQKGRRSYRYDVDAGAAASPGDPNVV